MLKFLESSKKKKCSLLANVGKKINGLFVLSKILFKTYLKDLTYK